mmetsp:Transcript_9827/g.14804  ORF Transcript_9827/g.14804 Transcript_9827/m.14804 type:complete len:504 (+) Transcript_9827:130-1641(+)
MLTNHNIFRGICIHISSYKQRKHIHTLCAAVAGVWCAIAFTEGHCSEGGTEERDITRIKQRYPLPQSQLDNYGVAVWKNTSSNTRKTYWNNESAYVLSEQAVDKLQRTSYELHTMLLEAVDLVIGSDELLDEFEVPQVLRPALKKSWKNRDKDLLGRIDILWDGTGDPKLINCEADTPSMLVESALMQKLWFDYEKEKNTGSEMASAICFNQIHEMLVKSWQDIVPPGLSTSFVSAFDVSEIPGTDAKISEGGHMSYLLKTAQEAGVTMSETSIDLLDFLRQPTKSRHMCIKDYSYHDLAREPYGWNLFTPSAGAAEEPNYQFIEPPWKFIVNNPAILAVLWKMYPHHKNLIFATCDKNNATTYMTEPGQVLVVKCGSPGYRYERAVLEDSANSSDLQIKKIPSKSTVYLSAYDLSAPLIGCWMVFGRPAGICFHESCGVSTSVRSVIPHYIVGQKFETLGYPQFLSAKQQSLWLDIYGVHRDMQSCESNSTPNLWKWIYRHI